MPQHGFRLLSLALLACPLALAEDHKAPPGPPPAEEIFAKIDADHNGSISKEEFVQHGKNMQRRGPPPGGAPGGAPGGDKGEGRPPHPPEGGGEEGRKPPMMGGDDEDHPPQAPEGGKKPPKGEKPPKGDKSSKGEGEARPPHASEGGEEGKPPGAGGDKPRKEGMSRGSEMFDKADTDKSGSLSLEEFKAAHKDMRPPEGQRPPEGKRPPKPKDE